MKQAANPDVSIMADVEQAIQDEIVPPLLRKRGEPVFANSWEAEAYAIGNILVRQGVVSCREWMDLMAEAIRRAQQAGDPDTGETYYLHWCHALETLCYQKGFVSPESYQDLLRRWALAVANTPHGVPLAIENAEHGAPHHHHDSHHHHDRHDHHGDHHHHDHPHGDGQPSGPPPAHYWTPIHVTVLKQTGS